MTFLLHIAAASSLSVGSSGTRATQSSPRAPVPIVRTSDPELSGRVLAYWKARQAKDLGAAYKFYCAGYKAKVSRGEFLRMTRLVRFDFISVHIASVKPAANGAKVTVEYKFVLPFAPGETSTGATTDLWARDQSGWCKADELLLLPFPIESSKNQRLIQSEAPAPASATARVPSSSGDDTAIWASTLGSVEDAIFPSLRLVLGHQQRVK